MKREKRKSILIAATIAMMTAGIAMMIFAYSNNDGASVVVGQSKFSYSGANGLNPDANTSNNTSSVFVSSDSKMIVADSENNRVLIFNSIPSSSNAAADVVIGQPDMTSVDANQGGAVAANTLDSPYSAFATASKLYIADRDNNRVLIYNSIPTTDNQPADVVVGQPDKISSTAGLSATALSLPYGVTSDGTKLFIADRSNNRVLIFNSIPTTDGASANVVVGQPDMTSNLANNGGISAKSLQNPRFAYSDGTKLFIADTNNHRVLIFNSIPGADFASADVVIGQPDMVSNTGNNGGLSASTLYYPQCVYTDGTKLFITDTYNHRVLIFNSVPAVDGASANTVIGQINMTSASSGASASKLAYPITGFYDGTKFFIADSNNHRGLIFNTLPTSDGASADYAIGQQNLTDNSANQGSEVTASNVSLPYSAYSDGTKLFIADRDNSRVLIYNSIPTVSGTSADVVVGQPDMVSSALNQGGTAATNTLKQPRFAFSDGTKLFIADTNNNRVLIYNSIPVANDANADVVVGQPDMVSALANQGGGPAANTLYTPMSISVDSSGKLYIADTYNHRVLIYNSVPAVNDASANVVVGQPDKVSNIANNGGISAAVLWYPTGVYSDNTKLYIADSTNHRVLIFNSIPAADGTSADVVVGQPDMVSRNANQGAGAAANTLNTPNAAYSDGTSLFVADSLNHRMLIFNSIPVADNTSADTVIGQPDMTSSSINQGEPAPASNTLNWPATVYDDGTYMYIADLQNNRVLIYSNTAPYIESGQVIYY